MEMVISKKIKALLLAGALCVGMSTRASEAGGFGIRSIANSVVSFVQQAHTMLEEDESGRTQFYVGCAFLSVCYGYDWWRRTQRELRERPLRLGNELMYHNTVERIRRLLEQGADVNYANNVGYTPLHLAVLSGNLAKVRLFLDHGANINAQNFIGKTPLDLARSEGIKQLITDAQQQRAKSRVLALECLATKDGDTREDGTQKPFNVMSRLSRELRTEVQEFATCEVRGYEGRGLSSERLNIEYRVQQKQEEQE